MYGGSEKHSLSDQCQEKSNIGKIVEMTNKLINEGFNQDLNLDDVSRELHISPQYLSRLYKNETGENFIERLTSVRIEHAKKLLRLNRYSIKEVCYMSGYSDPNYFQQIVQKACGEVPDRLSETEPVRLLQAGMRTF